MENGMTAAREKKMGKARCWRIERYGLAVQLLRCRTQLWTADLQGLKDSHGLPPTLSPWETVERRSRLLFLPHPYSLSFTVLIHLSRYLSCRSFLFLPSFLDNPLSCYYHSESYHQITVKSNPRERWTVMKIEIITTNELAFSVSVCLHANDPFISVASLTGLPLLVMWLKCVLSKGCRPRCTGSSNGEKERNHKQEL